MVKKLLLFTLITIILVASSHAYESQDTSNTNCLDSDFGINYKTKGGITLGTNVYTDECITQEVLKEFYCAGTKVISQNYKCTYSCNNGACSESLAKKAIIPKTTQKKIQESPSTASNPSTCTDTDRGIDLYNNGIATLYKDNNEISKNSDFCASSNILYEKYCKFSTSTNEWKIEQFNYNCECTNGRCLQKSKTLNIGSSNEIQSSPPQSLINKFLSFLGIIKSPTSQAVRETPKQEFNLSWILLLLFMIAGILYLRSIFKEPSKKKNKSKGF